MTTGLILISEYSRANDMDDVFINLLIAEGLIDIQQIDGEDYVEVSRLSDIERYSRMYYDLSINIEGIDAINHLLNRMKMLQDEVNILKQQIRLYEG